MSFRFGYINEGVAESEKPLLGMCLQIIYSGVFIWKGDSKNGSETFGLSGHR